MIGKNEVIQWQIKKRLQRQDRKKGLYFLKIIHDIIEQKS